MGARPAADDAVDLLIADHVRIRALLAELVGTAGRPARPAALHELKALLAVHDAIEDVIIYPAIDELVRRADWTRELYKQMDENELLLVMLEGLDPSSPDFVHVAERFRDLVLAHIDGEEREAFPALRAAAGPLAASLTQAVIAFRTRVMA